MSDNHFRTDPPPRPETVQEAVNLMLLLVADIRNDSQRIRRAHEWGTIFVMAAVLSGFLLYAFR